MKKIFVFAACAATLFLSAGCLKEDLQSNTNSSLKTGKSVVKVTAEAPDSDTRTRTAITYDETQKTFNFSWLAGDQIRLYEMVYENSSEMVGTDFVCGDSEGLDTDKDVAQFTVNLDEHGKPEGAKYKYVGIYGGSPQDYPTWQGNYATLFVELPIWQTPGADTFAPAADILVSKIIESDPRPDSLSLQFARVGGIIKLDLKGLPKGCEIKEGCFVNDEGFATAYMIEYDPVLQKSIVDGFDKPSNFIGFPGYDADESWHITADASGNATVWLRCVAGQISEWFEARIGYLDGEGMHYMSKLADVRSAGKTIRFTDGGITHITATLLDSDIQEPYPSASYGDGKIIVTWDSVENAGGYICYELTGEGTDYDIERLEYSEDNGICTAEVSSPTSGRHNFRVLALGSEGHGASVNEYGGNIAEVIVPRNDVSVSNPAASINGAAATVTATLDSGEASLEYSSYGVKYSSTESTLDGLKSSGKTLEGDLNGSTITVQASGLYYGTKYYYTVYAIIEEISYYSEVKSFTTAAMPVPTAVDLGLSVKWASFNLGASKPGEYGYYYSWAETSPRESCASYDYKWYNSGYTKYTGDEGTMEEADDAARVNLGGSWRLPTEDEWLELKNNCNFADDTVEGLAGIRATSTKNSNSIFFPYAGFAGSSSSSYANKDYVGTKAGIMLSTYQSGNKCLFGKMPDNVDSDYCTMMSSLFSVRAVQ